MNERSGASKGVSGASEKVNDQRVAQHLRLGSWLFWTTVARYGETVRGRVAAEKGARCVHATCTPGARDLVKITDGSISELPTQANKSFRL